MKNNNFAVLFLTTLLCFVSCSKDEGSNENQSSYTPEQQKVLKVLYGTFISTPDAVGTTTEFSFFDTFLNTPKNYEGKDIYGDVHSYTIHGLCFYKYNFATHPDDTKYERAFYLLPNGNDLYLYKTSDYKTINANASAEKYKITIISDNQIKLTDTNFPLNGSVYTRE